MSGGWEAPFTHTETSWESLNAWVCGWWWCLDQQKISFSGKLQLGHLSWESLPQWESHWFFVCEGSSVCISFPRKIAHVSRNFKTGLLGCTDLFFNWAFVASLGVQMHQQQKCDAFVVAWVTNANDMHVFFALDFPRPPPFLGVCVTVQLVQIRNNSIATSPAPVSMVINIFLIWPNGASSSFGITRHFRPKIADVDIPL